ncbi:venom allergen 4-like [Anoplolepis gracilipes]|uniref:venom allergen 4-like n=1 Tax=Anoplolepis gracilipes TaxID=354296 RepID=UPI003B9F66C8
MKNFVLIACLLTIFYASKSEKVKEVYNNSDKCIQIYSVSQEFTPLLIKCVLQKLNMIDKQGSIKKNELITYFDNIISNKTKLNQTKYIVSTCIDQANHDPGNNDIKTMTAINCGMSVIDLFD